MQTPELVAVTSSNIKAIGYDLHSQSLYVQFTRKGGAPFPVYRYIAVSPEVHREFMDAPSKGGFFSARIKSSYSVERMPA